MGQDNQAQGDDQKSITIVGFSKDQPLTEDAKKIIKEALQRGDGKVVFIDNSKTNNYKLVLFDLNIFALIKKIFMKKIEGDNNNMDVNNSGTGNTMGKENTTIIKDSGNTSSDEPVKK